MHRLPTSWRFARAAIGGWTEQQGRGQAGQDTRAHAGIGCVEGSQRLVEEAYLHVVDETNRELHSHAERCLRQELGISPRDDLQSIAQSLMP